MQTGTTWKAIRVGIVDDHAIFRDGLKSLLKRVMGPALRLVLECADGGQVADGLSGTEVDLVFMDVQMPVLDGIQATAVIQNLSPYTKVIALSSFGELSPVLEMVNAGARGYLLKNVGREELGLAIREVLAGRLYFTPQVESLLRAEAAHGSVKATNPLSQREVEVLRLVCRGKTNKEIGDALFISKRTVDGHRERIMQKTDCANLIQLFLFALRNDLYRPG